jgi:hypothetical protein
VNLSFLNPWFWLGALALAAPLWLHLHRKQEKNLLPFSTLRFLDDEPEPRASPRRLRDWLLFALRVLALLLVLAAFAWPYLRNVPSVVVKESRVYILDNTLSHQAADGFAQDRDRLLGELAKAGTDVQLAVIELTSQPKAIMSFGDERATGKQKLGELRPSFQRGAYLAAFRLAHSLLQNSLGERKRIVFLSDHQENQWSENLNAPAFMQNVQVDLPRATTAARPNLWLAEPHLQRVFLGDKSIVNFTVKLGHVGDAAAANVVLRANDQVIFDRAVPLTNQPETILLQAQWEAEPALWLRGDVTVQGHPDALAGDNRIFFTLPPLVEGRVALLAQSPYLRSALSPEVMRGQWSMRILDPTGLAAEVESGTDADVLCVESTYLQSADARKLLARYLANNRGVLLLLNRATPGINGCLRELGFEADTTVDLGKAPPEKLQFIVGNHAIFHPFVSPEYGNLLEVGVAKYVRLKSNEAIPLVFSEKGSPLFFQSTRPHGKLFVAAFGLDREHSSWPVHPTFIPFLDLTLQAARAEDATPANCEPGELALIALPPGAGVRQVVLHEADRELLRAPVDAGVAQVRMPLQPGVFTLTYDDAPAVQKSFSVNPSPKESQLTYVEDPDALKTWCLGATGEAAARVAPAPLARLNRAAVLQQHWWWWMLAAAAAMLALEMTLAGWRRTTS